MNLKTLDDGRTFPQLNDETLSWSLGLYHTIAEEQQGFPKMHAVARAMRDHRPEQLQKERSEMLKGSFDRMFGHNAAKELKVIDAVLAELPLQHDPAVIRAFPCSACKGAGSCSVCHTL